MLGREIRLRGGHAGERLILAALAATKLPKFQEAILDVRKCLKTQQCRHLRGVAH
jgi:hypothetical protein